MQIAWMPHSELFWSAVGLMIVALFIGYLADRLLPRWGFALIVSPELKV